MHNNMQCDIDGILGTADTRDVLTMPHANEQVQCKHVCMMEAGVQETGDEDCTEGAHPQRPHSAIREQVPRTSARLPLLLPSLRPEAAGRALKSAQMMADITG